MRFFSLLAAVAVLGAASGCATNEEKKGAEAEPAAPQAAAPATAPPGTVAPPPGMAVGTGGVTPTPELDARIAELEKAKNGDKKKLAAVYAERGSRKMNDAQASPRVKYRAALKDYRSALALDPANERALQDKKLIEDIYTSMGRPIPTE